MKRSAVVLVVVILGLSLLSLGGYSNYLPVVSKGIEPTPTQAPQPTATPAPTPTPIPCNGYAELLSNPSFEEPLLPYWKIRWSGVSHLPARTNTWGWDGYWSLFFDTGGMVYQTVTVPEWAETGAIYLAYFSDYANQGVYYDLVRGNAIIVDGIVLTPSPGNWIALRVPIANMVPYRGQVVGFYLAGTRQGVGVPIAVYADKVWLAVACGDQVLSEGLR